MTQTILDLYIKAVEYEHNKKSANMPKLTNSDRQIVENSDNNPKSDPLSNNLSERKETQLERVFDYIAEGYPIQKTSTWDLESWAGRLVGKEKMMGGSATRHARTLCIKGRVIHPEENGVKNKHYYTLPK